MCCIVERRVSVEQRLREGTIDFFCVNQIFDGMIGMNEEHRHNYYEVFYMAEGERIFYQNGIPYKVSKNQIIVIPPEYSHMTISVKPARQVLYFFGFPADWFDDFIPGYTTKEIFSSTQLIADANEGEGDYVTGIISGLDELSQSVGALRTARLKSAVFDLIFNHTGYAQSHDNDIYVSQGKLNPQVKYMMMSGYIKKNFAQKLTLDMLAEKFDVSKCEISRNFKKYVGASFVEYINTLRITEAQSLISCTDSSFVDVAVTVGFDSLSRFGKVFRQISSMTPSEFKKHVREQQEKEKSKQHAE